MCINLCINEDTIEKCSLCLSLDGDKITLGGHKYTEDAVDALGGSPRTPDYFLLPVLQLTLNC